MCNVLGLLFEGWTEQYCPLSLNFRSWNRTPSQGVESSQASGPPSGTVNSLEDLPVDSTAEGRLPDSDPRWRWLSYEKFESKDGKTKVKICDENKDSAQTDHDDEPFKVYYRRRVHTLWPDVVELLLTSPSLIKILRRYLPDHSDLKSLPEPKVAGRDLYMVLQSLNYHDFGASAQSSRGDLVDKYDLAANGSQPADRENHWATLGEGGTKEPGTDHKAASTSLHAKHLVRFLKEEYKDVMKRESRMRGEKRVAWDMLWTFLPKGAKVGYYCDISGKLLCAEVAGTYYTYESYAKMWLFTVDLDMWDFDGTRYKKCRICRNIETFHQERHFSELAVCPIEILGDPFILNDMLLANGRKFYELAIKCSNRFMFYKGPLYQKRGNRFESLHKEKGDGRVMIDLGSFAAMNPDYPMGKARPSTSTYGFRGFNGTGESLPPSNENGLPPGNSKTKSENNPIRKHENVSDSTLILAPAIVYGFSFKLKKWGSFAVSECSDVVFDREAFRELTMEQETKSLVYDLVGQYTSSSNDSGNSSERVDPIAEKGEGCIFLCHGPPGTGKTLTAESIAENLERPLWAMSVAELGTTPAELETKLLRILDIAARWKAVLLLDEADIYLEKRTSGPDVVRNAMTGVFLRQLEYYRGILFLTTNRIGMFDDAFRSRISLFLQYRELSLADRAKIWKTLMTRAKVEGVTDNFCDEMASQNLNGREIRNVIHTTQVWAKRKKERFAASHIKYVVGIFVSSLAALNQDLKTG